MHARSRVDAGSRMEPDRTSLPPLLTDEQWSLISDLFVDPPPDPAGGRPRVDARRCVEGVLWILVTGARWKDLPKCFPSPATCWRRFADWSADGVWERAWRRLLDKLNERGLIRWEEGFADGTFASAKKGAIASVQPNAARARSSWCSPTAPACRSHADRNAARFGPCVLKRFGARDQLIRAPRHV